MARRPRENARSIQPRLRPRGDRSWFREERKLVEGVGGWTGGVVGLVFRGCGRGESNRAEFLEIRGGW